MKIKTAFLLVTGLTAALQAASAADVTGTVTLTGTPPPEKDISAAISKDPFCSKLKAGSTEKVFTQFYVVGADKGLADVVVMLKGDSLAGKSTGASAQPAVLDQKGCMYVPQILAIQAGQKLLVKNSDPMPVPMHNVHINPMVPANQKANAASINAAQVAGAPDLNYTFPAAEGFLKFQCDVHQWMLAWVTVVDHPYFAVTGKDGSFKISDVPPGKYKVVALHRKAAPTGVDKDVDVTAGSAKVDFTLEVK